VFNRTFVNKDSAILLRTFVNKDSAMLLRLYQSLVRPKLEYCVQAWRPHLRKDIDLLEKVQKRAILSYCYIIKGLKVGPHLT